MKTNTETAVLSTDTLRKAVELSELIERSKNELNNLLMGKAFAAETPVAKNGKTGKRKLSAEAKAAIVEGQRRRWRKVHREAKLAAKAAATPIVVTPPPVGTPEPAKGFETAPLEATT
jgi:hypothetical protein